MRRCHIDGQESTDVLEMNGKPATREQPERTRCRIRPAWMPVAPAASGSAGDCGCVRCGHATSVARDVIASPQRPAAVTRRLMPLSAEPESFVRQSIFLVLRWGSRADTSPSRKSSGRVALGK